MFHYFRLAFQRPFWFQTLRIEAYEILNNFPIFSRPIVDSFSLFSSLFYSKHTSPACCSEATRSPTQPATHVAQHYVDDLARSLYASEFMPPCALEKWTIEHLSCGFWEETVAGDCGYLWHCEDSGVGFQGKYWVQFISNTGVEQIEVCIWPLVCDSSWTGGWVCSVYYHEVTMTGPAIGLSVFHFWEVRLLKSVAPSLCRQLWKYSSAPWLFFPVPRSCKGPECPARVGIERLLWGTLDWT